MMSIETGILDVTIPISTRLALVERTDCFGNAMEGDCSEARRRVVLRAGDSF